MSDSRHCEFGAVVLAASFGGLQAFKTVLRGLPEDFPASVLLVQHREAPGDRLANLLSELTSRTVVPATDGMKLEPGTIYVLPPLGRLRIDSLRRISFSGSRRLSADHAFSAVAARYGARSIGVVLTGRLDDGAAGSVEIKQAGGRVLAQDSGAAAAGGMPAAAAATGCVDHVLPLEGIAPALVSLVMVPGAADLFKVKLNPWAVAA